MKLKSVCLIAVLIVVLTGCGGASPPADPKVAAPTGRPGVKQVARTEPVTGDGKNGKGQQTALVTAN